MKILNSKLFVLTYFTDGVISQVGEEVYTDDKEAQAEADELSKKFSKNFTTLSVNVMTLDDFLYELRRNIESGS